MAAPSKLLCGTRALMYEPQIAAIIGDTEAVVLQQVHYLLLNPKSGRVIEGEHWIFNTYEQWQSDYFPHWCLRTIKAAFKSLKKRGLIESCQPDGRRRHCYYRLNSEAVKELVNRAVKVSSSAKSAPLSSAVITLPAVQELPDAYTESSDKVLNAESSMGVFLDTDSSGSSDKRKKKQKPYSSTELGMESQLLKHGIEPDLNYDGDFFDQMTNTEWKIQGEPIHDWIAVYQARRNHIEESDPNW